MRLREKLSLGFLTLAALVGVVGYASMTINTEIEESAVKLGTSSVLEARLAHEMDLALRAAQANAEEALLHAYRATAEADGGAAADEARQRSAKAARDGLRRFREQFALAKGAIDGVPPTAVPAEEDAAPREQLEGTVERYGELLTEYLGLLEEPRAAWQFLDKTLGPHFQDRVLPAVEAFSQASELNRSGRVRTVLNSINRANRLIMMSTLAAFFFAAFLGLFLSGRVSNPISKLTAAAVDIGKGRLDTRVDVRRKDDLGTLAETFNRMAETLSTTMVSKAYVDNIIRSMGDALLVTDCSGVIRRVNRATLNLLGCAEDELLGQPVKSVLAEKDTFGSQQFHLTFEEDVIRNLETAFRASDGRAVPVALSVSPMTDSASGERGLVFAARDITARKRGEAKLLAYQKQLRSLASHTSLAEERQRRHVARELDDRIGDSLAACQMKLGALREEASEAEFTRALDEVREILDQTIHQTRSLEFELSSPILYELGLEAALEALVQQAAERSGLQIPFQDDGEPKTLDEAVRVVLFQAVRGLLDNVVEHAEAEHASVALRRRDDAVEVEVEDDGVGFDPATIDTRPASTKGFGLFEIRERLSYLGGTFDVTSRPGGGTRVRVSAPLKSPPQDREEGP